ncbi:MAG: L-seryl-tRNA(Sec) selenium transferase [Clostridia bacterium]|nr:L-seryl-tRNA(Sec) selenium transferase [Clostridia bacterium]
MPIQDELRKLPGVDKVLQQEPVRLLMLKFPGNFVTGIIQNTLSSLRTAALQGAEVPPLVEILKQILSTTESLTAKSLRPVINATGIIIHTNLGRAPFGQKLLDEVNDVLTGYNNLEFDLDKAQRGTRYTHVTRLLCHLTGAEDVLVVNNNAAAIMLVLRALAKNREVIISRGELIEIGGSFRMPDIMAASDCQMVEVGTTNKTKVADFANAITARTGMLLKVHPSNYVISGFTTEASLPELVALGAQHQLPVVYDMGSGLLRQADIAFLADEPDVRSTLATGIDLVTFSGDKLLGGPQAGIIAGKRELIAKLKKEPLTRALRVGKETLSMLETIALAYLDTEKLIALSPIFTMMTTNADQLRTKAESLQQQLEAAAVVCSVVKSEGQAGGGSLPGKTIDSFAVAIHFKGASRKIAARYAEQIYHHLLTNTKPLLAVLRQGEVQFDVLTLFDHQISEVAALIVNSYREVTGT